MDYEASEAVNFPGLYSDFRRNNESDFEDDHEKFHKKDLLIGKRKDKKDKGYAVLDGESSGNEESDVKMSPFKRKSRLIKFSMLKEKREKSRENEGAGDKDKKKDKPKSKIKEKNKKHTDPIPDIGEEFPIFGVPLAISVERNPCHDGIPIPLVVRTCVEYIEQYGLHVEDMYKITAVKNRVQQVITAYNKRKSITNTDWDLAVATNVLKHFLRSLPEMLLTKNLTPKFEETLDVSVVKELMNSIPECNRTLANYLFLHFQSVIAHKQKNKTNVVALGAIFCPFLQTSQILFSFLVAEARKIFPVECFPRYIPPLQNISPVPLDEDCLMEEMQKQESLLALIHFEMNAGFCDNNNEENLWTVQRNITRLKRNLKVILKLREMENAKKCARKISTTTNTISPAAADVTKKENYPAVAMGKKSAEELGSIQPECEGAFLDTVKGLSLKSKAIPEIDSSKTGQQLDGKKTRSLYIPPPAHKVPNPFDLYESYGIVKPIALKPSPPPSLADSRLNVVGALNVRGSSIWFQTLPRSEINVSEIKVQYTIHDLDMEDFWMLKEQELMDLYKHSRDSISLDQEEVKDIVEILSDVSGKSPKTFLDDFKRARSQDEAFMPVCVQNTTSA